MKSSNIGGQAVMEGIMMRHEDKYSIAVRRPDGEIEVKIEDYKSVLGKYGIFKKPIFRGVAGFVDSLVVGTRCLMYSASFFEEEENTKKKEKTEQMNEEELSKFEAKQAWKDKLLIYGTTAFSVVAAVALFMVLPYLLASTLRMAGAGEGLVTLVESFVKILIFLGYMLLISKMEDIQRVFMYHGAEHKCINCVEHGMELNVENVLKSSRLHKRCGTSFLLLVMVVSILFHLVFIFVPAMWMRVVGRILMVPLIAGVAYEFIRLAGTSENKLVVLLSRPGLELQRITTREPDAAMAEVAITAVEAVFDWREYLKGNGREEQEA